MGCKKNGWAAFVNISFCLSRYLATSGYRTTLVFVCVFLFTDAWRFFLVYDLQVERSALHSQPVVTLCEDFICVGGGAINASRPWLRGMYTYFSLVMTRLHEAVGHDEGRHFESFQT